MKYTKPNEEKRKARIERMRSIAELQKELRAVDKAIALKERKAIEKVPVKIFATKLSPAEALVKWLKENHNLSYTEIAAVLNRDVRSIWTTYQDADKKRKTAFKIESGITIPLTIFTDRKLSILEHIVLYLRTQQGLSLTKISELLGKHYNTICTVYTRGRRKQK